MDDFRIVKVVPVAAEDLAALETLKAASLAAQTEADKARGKLSVWYDATLRKLYPEHFVAPTSRMDSYVRKPAASMKIQDGFAVIGLEYD